MDKVVVNGLRVEAIIGIHDWERRVRQPLDLSLEVATEVARVAAEDDIALAVDYHALSTRVADYIVDGEFRLLETLAEQTAAMILAEFGVSWVRLAVYKPGAVPAAENVGVIIEREAP